MNELMDGLLHSAGVFLNHTTPGRRWLVYLAAIVGLTALMTWWGSK